MMWALIMTTVYYLGSGISTFEQTAIDGFTSEQACRYAGATQEVALRNDLKIKTDKRYTFICVKKGE